MLYICKKNLRPDMKPRPQNYTRRKRRSAWPEATPTDIPNGYKWMKSFCGFNNFNTLRFFMTDLFLWSVGFGVKRAPVPIGLWLSFSCLGFSVLFRFCRCSSGLELVWRAAALRSSHRMNEKAAASLHISKQEVAWIEAGSWWSHLLMSQALFWFCSFPAFREASSSLAFVLSWRRWTDWLVSEAESPASSWSGCKTTEAFPPDPRGR